MKRAKASEARRPSAQARGYDARWARESRAFLALPGNERCACGCGRIATMVDHRIAPKGDARLFWDRTNWQPFAAICNTRKAIASEGGFGRKPAGTGGAIETFNTGAPTAWGPSRDSSRNSDRGGNSQ